MSDLTCASSESMPNAGKTTIDNQKLRPIIIRPYNSKSSNQVVAMIDLSKSSPMNSDNLSVYTLKPYASNAPIITFKESETEPGKLDSVSCNNGQQQLQVESSPLVLSSSSVKTTSNTSYLSTLTSSEEKMHSINSFNSSSTSLVTNNFFVSPRTYICPDYYLTFQSNNGNCNTVFNNGPLLSSVRSLAPKANNGTKAIDISKTSLTKDSPKKTTRESSANCLPTAVKRTLSNSIQSDSTEVGQSITRDGQNDLLNMPDALSKAKTDVLNGLRTSSCNSFENNANILPYTALKSALENKYYPINALNASFSPQSKLKQGRMSCSPKKGARDCLDYNGKVAIVTPTARKRLLHYASQIKRDSPASHPIDIVSSPKKVKLMSNHKAELKQNKRKTPVTLEPITISDDETSEVDRTRCRDLIPSKASDLQCEETLSADECAFENTQCPIDSKTSTDVITSVKLNTEDNGTEYSKKKATGSFRRTVRIHPSVPLAYTPEQVRELKSNFHSAFSVDLSQLPKIEDCLDVVPVYSAIISALEEVATLDRYKTRFVTAHQMMKYIKRNYLQRVLSLLVQGCDPTQKVRLEQGRSCLHAAVGNMEILLCLLYACAGSVDIADNNSVTPLMAAAAKDQLAAVKLLYRCGGSLEKSDSEGKSVIHICASNRAHNVLRWLCPKVKDVNVQDNGGWTALMWSADEKSGISTKVLLDHGACPFLVDEERNHCLHWAVLAGSKSGCHDLIKAGSPVNGINIHQETPLHIAAKEGNFDIVQMLLLNSGDTTIVNKDGNTPRQLAIPGSRIDAILAVKGFINPTAKSILYCSDFTRGREKVAISCVNEVDDCPAPDMCYITENVETGSVHVLPSSKFFKGCNCEGNCLSQSSCSCVELSEELTCWYNEDGILNLEVFDLDRPALYECSRFCRCWSGCVNRVVQRGIHLPLQIYKTSDRGWGLRCLEDIPKGTFICSYLGEVLSDDEANTRADDTYLFDLDVKDSDDISCIDASYYGNVARFINHSCEANIIPIRVFYGHRDISMPEMAFFAMRDIEPNEEICLDYGEKYWSVKMLTDLFCNCGHSRCRYKRTNSNISKCNQKE